MGTTIPDDIPIVALSRHILLPRVRFAFHLPRPFYEDMEENFPSQERFLGVLLKNEMSILPIGCVGKILRAQPLACGRAFHLELIGLTRFRHQRECIEEGQSTGSIQVLDEGPGTLAPARRIYLLETLENLKDKTCLALVGESTDNELLINELCVRVDIPLPDKYLLMETGDINQRCGRLIELLRMKAGAIRFP